MNDPATDAAAFWNRRYNEPELAYGDNPNDFLRQQAETLPLGMHSAWPMGRDAMPCSWLAWVIGSQPRI